MPEDECDDLMDIIDTAYGDLAEEENNLMQALRDDSDMWLEVTKECGIAILEGGTEFISDLLCFQELVDAFMDEGVIQAYAAYQESLAFVNESNDNYWDCIDCPEAYGD